MIEIAIDHLNRIVTPFANPVVRTVAAASTSVDGHVVYVATSTEEPLSLCISPRAADRRDASDWAASRYRGYRSVGEG